MTLSEIAFLRDLVDSKAPVAYQPTHGMKLPTFVLRLDHSPRHGFIAVLRHSGEQIPLSEASLSEFYTLTPVSRAL
jgi:hypothetical protein